MFLHIYRTNTELWLMNVPLNWAQGSDLIIFLPHPCLASNPNACRATGRGLQPKGVRVKEVADFKVFTRGAGTGELKIMVKGPSKYDFLST